MLRLAVYSLYQRERHSTDFWCGAIEYRENVQRFTFKAVVSQCEFFLKIKWEYERSNAAKKHVTFGFV